jgi:hypothetical protein
MRPGSIEEIARLKAVVEGLSKMDPRGFATEHGGGRYYCKFCHEVEYRDQIIHKTSCIWQQAVNININSQK